MNMKLELVPVPVSDIDRAKDFYVGKLGFVVDVDVTPTDTIRIVQLTPQGSACSIVLGKGMPLMEMQPGILRGLHLVVEDINEARKEALAKGVEVSDVQDQGGGMLYAAFSDPDGNMWTFQEMPAAR
jgi:catechol 2,3-dioxygenase-like lactoylglutathione lyase family enzyme